MRPVFLVRFIEAGRDAQRGGQRRDLAAALIAEVPGATVEIEPGRLIVEGDGATLRGALDQLLGIVSFSPAIRCALDQLDAVVAGQAAAIAPGGSFRVRVRRRGEVGEPDAGSRARAVHLGGVVRTARPDLRVDLHAPDAVIGVELRDAVADVFDEVVPGLDWRGDAPPATSGRPDELRFVADQMLGRLATWLRLLGHDTVHPWDQPDSWVLRIARDQGRIILTRDGPLAKVRSTPVYFVRAQRPMDQVAEVVRAFELEVDEARMFSRCPRCNLAVEIVEHAAVVARLPPEVAATPDLQIRRCPGCDQLYWRGAHVERILAHLRTLT